MRTTSPSTSGETEAWSCEPGTEEPPLTGPEEEQAGRAVRGGARQEKQRWERGSEEDGLGARNVSKKLEEARNNSPKASRRNPSFSSHQK